LPYVDEQDLGDSAATGSGPQAQIGHLLRRAYSKAKKNTTLQLRPLGLNPVQAAALAVLALGPLSQADLGGRIDMEPANVNSFVRRLAVLGLIEISRDSRNPRASRLLLTEEGRRVALLLPRLAQLSAQQTLRGLSAEEQRNLIALLRKLAL
jgi:DNA-binding MarR family transcriptional regulator